MSAEDRLRAATRARTALIHDVRPLELPDESPARAPRASRARHWLTWGAPIGAAAMVTALALVLVLLRQAGGPQSDSPAPAPVSSAAASVPRYYVALAYTGATSNPMEAVVGDDQTGREVAVLAPSASQNFYGVTAAADDRTFVVMNYDGASQETTWYLLRLTPGAAHPARLAKLPMKPLAVHVNGLALSPDGRELAVMYRTATTATNASTHLLVYSMSSGAVLDAWSTNAPNNNELGGNANSAGLSWVSGDHGLSFGWISPVSRIVSVRVNGTTKKVSVNVGQLTLRRLDVTPAGHDLLADSRLVLTVPPGAVQDGHSTQSCVTSLAASDGSAIVCSSTGGNAPAAACPALPPSFVSYSTATGKPLQVLYKYQGQCVNGQALLAWTNSSGSQAIGFILLVKVVNGKNTPAPTLLGVVGGGRFTPLPAPALVVSSGAAYNQGGIAF
jgi:hypothetical protein